MGLGDFWLQFNNGKKEQLNDTKHGVRKEQVDKKFHNLFDAYDTNNDGTLEESEVQTIFGHLKNFAGDNVLDSAENLKAQSIFAEQVNIKDVDFQGFVKSISDATADIISSEEKATSDGGKEIKTVYKDGTTETIAYYSNGDFKWKKIEKRFEKTSYELIINGKTKELTEEEFQKALNKLDEKSKTQAQTKIGIEGQKIIFPLQTQNAEVKKSTKQWEEHTQEYSPRFVAENLGIDINTEEGQKIVERISYLPKEALEQIKDGAELKDVIAKNDLPPNFDNISNALELLYGVTLRNEEEFEASKPQREKIMQQIQTVDIMSELYARVAEFNDNYTDNQGLFGMGAEGIGYLLNKVGIQGENHYQWADSCREFIEKINDFKVLNPAKFEEEFKGLTGKEKFNVEALQKMVELAKDGKAQDEYGDYTDEYKQAVKDFSNFDVSNPNAKAWYHPDNLLGGFGEALIMIATLGWGAETKAGQMLATSTMATFSRLGVTAASKQVNNKLLQGALRLSGQGVKLLGPALNEGTKMYAYTAAVGTATNVANRAIKFDSEENTLDKFLNTEAMVLDSATGSFGFGAFAGAFGSTVTQKVMQRASRVSQKVGTALSDKFAAGAVDANEVFTTILEKSAPTKIAEAAAFATDVLGFTAFESVLAIVKNLDNYPDGYSVEDLTNVIWEELKSQGYNLGQIKIVAWLLSSRSARMQATRYMKDAMPQLKGVTIEGVNGGKDGYKINLPDGRKIECKNTVEYISALHLMVRGETAFSSKFDITSKERFRLNCEKLGMSETEVADLEAYQQTAINYVKKVQNDNAKRAFSIRIKDGYSSELFPDIKESRAIKRNSKKMIQELEENPKLVELYRELERIQKAENERTGYDQDINSLHSYIQYILEHTNHENAGAAIELARFIESKGTEHVSYLIEQNLQYTNISETDVKLKKAFYEAIKNDPDITEETRLELLQYLDENSCEYITAIYPYLKPEHKNKTSCSNAGDILYCKTKADADVKLEIFKKYGVESFSILKDITAENGKTAKLILEDNTLSDTVRWAMFDNEEAMKKYQELKDDPDILDSDINTLLFGGKTSGCIELIENTESIEVYKYFSKKEGFPKELVAGIAVECNEYTKEFALMMSEIQDFPPEQIAPILREVKAKGDIIIGSWSKEELTKLNQSASALLSSGMPPEIIAPTIKVITKENLDYSLDICTNWQKQELLPKQVPLMIYYKDHISTQQFRKLNRKLGADVVSKLVFDDIYLGAKFADIIDVKNINEIPLAGKKEFIRNLVDCNTGMFEISDDLKLHLPLLPTDNEQYCGLMRAAVKSLGIETNPLTPEQKITLFNHSMKNLSETMANLSDSEFAGLSIKQEFSREDFISVVREKTKGLSDIERQKVYDYYGFEIHHKKGRNQRKELTLTGYPVNLNNGQKLAEITDPNTKAVVESLREDVVRFSEKNPIKCNNKQIETFLNEVVEAMPEIRSMIGRKQHGTHDFDVMQHSLKVMQKIVQDPKFEQLNESDKKLMLLASLLHDITKAEGISDGTHASEGSFDAYYIAKKFKLSRDEELKLSDLIRHHEWLGNVNRDIRINTERMKPEEAEKKKQEILTKRLQAAAFDMQNDNLFDMVMIFTHADLKAVKSDDTFHDTRNGDTRAVFDKNNNRVFDPIKQAKGVRKSHGEAADIYAKRIREYIHELQKTRPLTPTTKIPTMSEIRTHITQINPDGSTNIKGVYVDTDGLIVIKVNDVEDWEAMGFPAGTTTKGILANVNNNGEEVHQVETGNFKIMAHGLDFPNQLAKFEAFSLPSSESMLSLTYMERPETKSRNFRPQGVGLDLDSKYIYGGGETDAGSGCGKTISDFKADYIFGGHREGDRKFVADIVKKATGMTDEEYIQFYEANKDKAWEEFDNQDIANALIRAYAEGIHSNVRYGERAYTEFYGSNPKRVNSTWVFSLDPEEKIGNPLEFLHRTDLTDGELNSADIGGRAPRSVADRTQFLREFSLNKDHDVPMFIFGDSSVEKVVNEGVTTKPQNPQMILDGTKSNESKRTKTVQETKSNEVIHDITAAVTMSDAEFNVLAQELKSNPKYPKTDYLRHKFTRIDKENILFVQRLLNCKELTDKLSAEELRDIINSSYSKNVEAETLLLEKLQDNPDLLNNPHIVSYIHQIFIGTISVKALEVVDMFFAKPELLEKISQWNSESISHILQKVDNDYSISFMESILNNPKLLDSSQMTMHLHYIIHNTGFDTTNATKLELFNEFIKDSQNTSNIALVDDFASVIGKEPDKVYKFDKQLENKDNYTPEELKTLEQNREKSLRTDIFKNIFSELYRNKEFAEVSNKFYKLYLENEFKEYPEAEAKRFREMCEAINKEYGVKLILPSNLKEVGQSLILVYQELNNYKMHSNNQAKMPPVLDFMNVLAENIAGTAHLDGTNNIDIRELSITFIKHTLRHEMTHINDTKQIREFPEEIRVFKSEPKKDEWNGELVFDVHTDLDIDKCKYANELRNGGIPKKSIEYAYTNPLEFIAVASTGDFSKYSTEFKNYLVKLGMPEWMLKFQNLKPFFISRETENKPTNDDIKNTNPASIITSSNSENIEKIQQRIAQRLKYLDFDDMEPDDIHYEAEWILQELPHDVWKDMKNPQWNRLVEIVGEEANKYNLAVLDKIYVKFFLAKDGLKEFETPIILQKILQDIKNPTTAKLAKVILERDISLENYKDYIELCNENPEFAYKLYKSEKPIKDFTITKLYKLCNEGKCSQEDVNKALDNIHEKKENESAQYFRLSYYTEQIPIEYRYIAAKYIKEKMSDSEIQQIIDIFKAFDQNKWETLKTFQNKPDWQYSEKLTLENFQVGYKSILELDKSVYEKIPEAKEYVYKLALNVDGHWTSPMTYNTRMENLQKIAKYDKKTAQAFFKVIEALETVQESNDREGDFAQYLQKLDWAVEFHNLDYLAEYLKKHNYKIDYFVKQAIQSNIDVRKTEPIYQDIQAKKEQIIKEIKIKCKDILPGFEDWVEDFLYSKSAQTLMLIGDLNDNTLVNNFFYFAKFIKTFERNIENCINGNYSKKVIRAYMEYRQMGNKSPLYRELNKFDKGQMTLLDDHVKSDFDSKHLEIFRVVCATDIETVQQLLDKHLENLSDKIDYIIENIPDTYKPILTDLIRNGKQLKNGKPEKLSGRQKIELIDTVRMYAQLAQKGGIELNFEPFKKHIGKGAFVLDIDGLRKNAFNKILSNIGMSETEISELKPENLNWDYSNIYLLSLKVDCDEGELAELVKEASSGNFQNYIKSPDNKHGAANLETERTFAQEKLNYKVWQNGIPEKTIEINGKEYTIKLWNRIPQESLFDGTYTSCCTALDGSNGGSMTNYMLNTAINVVEIKDESGNVVAMSRCYVAKNSNGKPSLIIENIEVNSQLNDKLSSSGSERDLSESIFDYMKDFADAIYGKNMPVYMSTRYPKLGEDKIFEGYKTTNEKLSLVGTISKDMIYLNTFGSYVNPKNLEETTELCVIRNEKL